MGLALGAQIAAILPVFLLGGLFPLLRDYLGVAVSSLGVAVATFFGASAAGSAGFARLSDAAGPWPVTRGALLVVGAACCATALGQSYTVLVAAMAVAGAANGCVHPASNVAISGYVPHRRQGFAFGLKQSSVPLATMIGGLAVPVIGLTVGWRWAFVLAGGIALAMALILPRDPGARTGLTPHGTAEAILPMRLLLMLGVMSGLGAGSANAMAAFLVASVEDLGHSVAAAGVLMAAGSLASVLVRLLLGIAADRWPLPLLGTVAAMLFGGALGYAALAVATGWTMIVLGTLFAFAMGWSWAGLSLLAVVRANPGGAGRATGIMQSGLFIGAVAGPAGFGATAGAFGYPVAWVGLFVAGCAAAVAALLCARSMRRRARGVRAV